MSKQVTPPTLLVDRQDYILRSALDLATAAHAGQKDDDGLPHLVHCLRVACRCITFEQVIIGLLHDTIEDNPKIVVFDLLRRRFGMATAQAVFLLSRQDGMTYMEYITAIIDSGNIDVMVVKLSDLDDNLSRSQDPSCSKFYLRERWKNAKTAILAAASIPIPIFNGDTQFS